MGPHTADSASSFVEIYMFYPLMLADLSVYVKRVPLHSGYVGDDY